MCAMLQAHGNWVTGERFWDREEELALFISRIREGAHILLVAQRRMGKTSFRILKGEDYIITPERRGTAGEFMSWLRKNSLRHQGRVRIAISGSIGLEPVLRQANLSATVNNFVPFELKPWSPETTVGCIQALAATYALRLGNDVTAEMVTLLGCCIPHHVQMFFDHVKSHCLRRKTSELTLEEVRGVYKSDMLSTRGHAELAHYEERLKLVLGAERMALALEMLTEAAVTGCLGSEAIIAFRGEYDIEGEPTEQAQKEILWLLEHDGYLTQTADGYVFVSALLRDWWRNRYKMFYTPVRQRRS